MLDRIDTRADQAHVEVVLVPDRSLVLVDASGRWHKNAEKG
jgi:hypothetical protein